MKITDVITLLEGILEDRGNLEVCISDYDDQPGAYLYNKVEEVEVEGIYDIKGWERVIGRGRYCRWDPYGKPFEHPPSDEDVVVLR